MAEPHIPPMPDGFTDQAAWDAIHFQFAGNGCLLDRAVIGWQLDNQERCRAARAVSSVSSGAEHSQADT